MKKRFVFIGAGSSCIFAIFKLLQKGISGSDILIVDKGPLLDKRDMKKNLLYGFGGAGLFSDCKMNFSTQKDQPVYNFFTELEVNNAFEFIKNKIVEFWDKDKINISYPNEELSNIENEFKYEIFSLKKDYEKPCLKQFELWHIGTLASIEMNKKIFKFFEDQKISFIENKEILFSDINEKENCVKIDDKDIQYEHLFIGMGRGGKFFMDNFYKNNNIESNENIIQYGVRFETPTNEKIKDIISKQYDFKFSFDFVKNGLKINVRTFCCCHNSAYVVEELYNDKNSPNEIRIQFNGEGYNNDEKINNMSNFGIIVQVVGNEAKNISEKIKKKLEYKGFYVTGKNINFESNLNNIEEKNISEFQDIYGDISEYILDMITVINNIFEINHNYKFFVPEIKECVGTVKADPLLTIAEIKNIHLTGDSSPVNTRGIVPAAVTGIALIDRLL